MIRYVTLKNADKSWALPQIVALVEEAKDRGTAEHLNLQEAAFYERFFTDQGVAIGAYEADKLLGFALLGLDAFLEPLWMPYVKQRAINPAEVAIFVHILVGAEARGRGCGRELNNQRFLVARSLGRSHYFASVAPGNGPNLKLLEDGGFTAIDRRKIYEKQLDRYLMYYEPEAQPAAPELDLTAV